MNAHLDFLVATTSNDAGGSTSEKRNVDLWMSDNIVDTSIEDDNSVEAWPTVLDLYSHQIALNGDLHSPVVQLTSKWDLQDALPSILEALRSSRTDELLDIIGYGDIELVTELCTQRLESIRELEQYLQNPASTHELQMDSSDPDSLSPEAAQRRIERQLQQNASRPLFTGVAGPAPEVLPNVFTSTSGTHGGNLSQFGSRYLLPLGTTRVQHPTHEEVTVPPARTVPPRASERPISINELDPLAKGCFPGYTTLNRIQSIIYPTAYGTNENMLVCAPTGAGKTDVAMLTILRVLKQYSNQSSTSTNGVPTIRRDEFKIIYVAPMKALASEIVRKFSKRLHWLGIVVKELTGDMQLTKAEIAQTQIIVTTPEKWDVVTRKPTDEGSLAASLRLLIIDEVHLLNEERGAVIEAIVARTQRQVESSQTVIRIVGLSATLPNFVDVSDFLCVSSQKGLFYFDSSFRPIPLEQHFIGVKGKTGSAQSRKNLDTVTFDKVSELVAQGHQVMVFVHARKNTVAAAMSIREAAQAEGNIDDFSCQDHSQWEMFRKSISESRNKEMKMLFDSGFGIHHAGMLRSDRNMMERMFEARAIKVLCCTSTLAWGVNLPAHAVIIKGTQVYDSTKGTFVNLSVLDVLQVFGRAGRPGLESSGEGYICTTEESLPHYLESILSQARPAKFNPIESQFRNGLVDALNAEIALGTVLNIQDAVQWLGYTYLFVRMRKNPFVYGLDHDVLAQDSTLSAKRHELITAAVRKLEEVRMVVHSKDTGTLSVTDVGRVAAKYYVRHSSIEIYNKMFQKRMSEADVLAMLSKSTEFDQVQLRESEVPELKQLMETIPCEAKDGTDTNQGKVNILLQSYISRYPVVDFALVSDMAYAAQNGGRIIRALLEIAICRKWANVSSTLMGISKAIEKRLWPFEHPLKQTELKPQTLYNIQQWVDDWEVSDLAALPPAELGQMVHLNENQGKAISNAAKEFPHVSLEFELKPISPEILKISLVAHRRFQWNSKVHGTGELFWIWIEDQDGLDILQLAQSTFRQETVENHLDFFISISDASQQPSITVRVISDRWLGAEDEVSIPLESIKMPAYKGQSAPILDLPFLPISMIRDSLLEDLFSTRLRFFNSMQTQILWSLLNTRQNCLVCAPTGSGKTSIAQILCCLDLLRKSSSSVLIVTPGQDVSTEWMSDLRPISRALSVPLHLVTDRSGDLLFPARGRTIKVISCTQLLKVISKGSPQNFQTALTTVICEGLERLDADYELALSLLRRITQLSPTRFVGLSGSLNDPTDLAAWLDVHASAVHSFRPRDREQSLRIQTQTFTIPHSASLFKAMTKPAHAACSQSPSSIIFVPSRNLCRSISLDLITQCSLKNVTSRGYLPETVPEELVEQLLVALMDKSLVDIVGRGIGFFHAGMHRDDRKLVMQLYTEGVIRVLIVPREACWSLPVRASVVVVMGTQYIQFDQGGSGRQVRDYQMTELVRMQSRAIRHGELGQFFLFCQAENKETLLRFLQDGLPLESQLLEDDTLDRWYLSARRDKLINAKQQAVDALDFTFLSHRVVSNPLYYANESGSRNVYLSRLTDRLEGLYWAEQKSTTES